MINPVITNTSSNLGSSLEACLSVPSLFGIVSRHKNIHVKFIEVTKDNKLERRSEDFSGMDSFVIQHEIDHLDGILFIDRIKENGDNIKYSNFGVKINLKIFTCKFHLKISIANFT